jgi:hypothetical protein
MPRNRRAIAYVAAAVAAVACGDSITDVAVLEDLVVAASVLPAHVPSGGSATVRARATNRTNEALVLSFGMGCPYFLSVKAFPSGTLVPMHGTSYACVAMGMAREVPPHGTLDMDVEIRASVGGYTVPPGRYVALLGFNSATIPPLAVVFRVID